VNIKKCDRLTSEIKITVN